MNDSTPGFEPDDATRRLLHASDPAHALPPIPEDRLAALMEDVVTEPQNTPASKGKRFRVIGAVAAAAVVAAVATVALTSGGDDDKPRGGDSTPVAKQSVTELTTSPAAGKCMAPTPESVAAQQVAFEGTVKSIEDGTVTLAASHFWAGKASDLVTVVEPDANMSEMPVSFEVGQAYIIGATDGQVSICGLNGPATDELRAQYDAAFAQ